MGGGSGEFPINSNTMQEKSSECSPEFRLSIHASGWFPPQNMSKNAICQCHGQNMSKHVVYASVSIMASGIPDGWPITATVPEFYNQVVTQLIHVAYSTCWIRNCKFDIHHTWWCHVVSINEGTPIAGWFLVENPMKYAWFGGTAISGNLQICHRPT